jgi:glutathione synthase/RimK-type ligase-like ATP-grasp enzyme
MFIYPYKTGSASAKALSEAIGAKRIKRENSKFKGNHKRVVVNWGCTRLPEEVLKCQVLNKPEAVAIASDKLKFFKAMKEDGGVNIPEFTTDIGEAEWWIEEGYKVVERHKLNGHSGEGIVIVEDEDDLNGAPLYVKYIPKKSEWRIHVFQGEVVDVQRKARDRGVPDEQVNWQVRNHANGFIFARNEGIAPHEQVLHQAKQAVRACGLDFGAVDVVFNDKQLVAYVLEVNTACGLSGYTLDGYAERFGRLE